MSDNMKVFGKIGLRYPSLAVHRVFRNTYARAAQETWPEACRRLQDELVVVRDRAEQAEGEVDALYEQEAGASL